MLCRLSDDMLENGALGCLCEILAVCWNPDVVSSIVQSIENLCCENRKNADHAVQAGLIQNLCQIADLVMMS